METWPAPPTTQPTTKESKMNKTTLVIVVSAAIADTPSRTAIPRRPIPRPVGASLVVARVQPNIESQGEFLERAKLTAERKELYEEEHPETVSVRIRGGPGRGNKNETESRLGFVAATAKATGKGKTTVTVDAEERCGGIRFHQGHRQWQG
jgi:hypothetical protein